MKKFCILFFLLAIALTMTAQVGNPYMAATNNEDGVVHLEQWQRQAAKPGELLVKFHDRSDIRLAVDANGKCTNRFVSATKNLGINTVLDSYAIASIEQLMPTFVMPKEARVSKSYGGGDVVEHDLSQWHLIRIDNSELTIDNSASHNEYALMEALKTLDEVEYVEPNYLVFALGAAEPAAAVADATYTSITSTTRATRNTRYTSKTASSAPNDPMYSLQCGIPACGIDSLLTAPKRDSSWRPIIAIIDTGVDIDHADLTDNIWTNAAEANGATNQDDDGNGFRDDVHGWDFVNQTGQMHDFNSHGTHCAGIAGAVTNNGIGIAGACPDALIMPVCVMQSDGTGAISTIIQGINYARQNGADVISMSIGTYAYSVAMEQALAVAYQTAMLVAAAGNDAYHIDPRCCPSVPHQQMDGPMFPGAFTFVLGVQATQQGGGLAVFSNIDCDGPSYSQFNEEQLYNYELSAPGVGIMSTVPNGGYRNYNGTSMATPLVAGGVASLLQRREYLTKEILFGDLINYSHEFSPVDFWSVYNADSIAPAILELVALEINDTAYGDSSMYADAGERLQLYPTIRTVWGPADSVEMWLQFQEFEDTSTIQILQNHVHLGRPISSYAKAKSANPIDIQIAPNVVDSRNIRLMLCVAAPSATDTLRHDFLLRVTNGVKLHGMVTHNDTLWPNVHYIVSDNYAIASGSTLVIKPGCTIKFGTNVTVSVAGRILAEGTPDSMITLTKTDLGQNWRKIFNSTNDTFYYCKFEYFNELGTPGSSARPFYSNCIWENGIIPQHTYGMFFHVQYSNFYNNVTGSASASYYTQSNYNNMIDNIGGRIYPLLAIGNNYVTNSNIFGNGEYSTFATYVEHPEVYVNNTIYWGSSKESIVRVNEVYDFATPQSGLFGYLDLENLRTEPVHEAHGIVWKVEVNGYDAQDEFDSIIPLGVGSHEFKVYFNRAMDTSITPMLAMGVRPPYTQTAISENASWSADSTIYTAYLTLTGRMPIDGLNRIYVSGAQDDEHFEIPYENQRFNVYVASSGSMSAGFQATPGIGKVDLEWNDQEVNYEDFLGFNIYRYQYVQQLQNYHYNSDLGRYVYDTVTVPGDTIRLNTSLVQDTVFTDFNVIPGERYYYYYKILSTSLTENSPSKTVSCVPHSTIPGDANGSYAVDVADVITVINYVTGQNPQPFLFDAADVNGDGIINVLDIVRIINIILYPDQKSSPDDIQPTAFYTLENDTLYINTPVALGGIQLTLANCQRSDIEVLAALSGFECATVEQDGNLTMVFYSMSGASIPAGKTALLSILNSQNRQPGHRVSILNLVLSDTQGHNVVALNGDAVGINGLDIEAQFATAYPNPFTGKTRIDILVANYRHATILFTDLMGRTVDRHELDTPTPGRYSLTWDATGKPRGIYFATLYADGQKAQTIKLVVK